MHILSTVLPVLALSSSAFGHLATPHRRATDTCANVDLRLRIPLANVNIQVCACLGQVGAVVSGNTLLGAAVGTMGGMANVTAMVTSAVSAVIVLKRRWC
jgi:hypothetical protein